MIHVILVDDQDLVRNGIAALLERTEDITVTGEAASGAQALQLARTQQPDVILMDIRMPGMDGIEATKQITSDTKLHNIRVIVLTTFDTDEHIFDAIRVGASGFVLKSSRPNELRNVVRTVAGGEALLSPSITRRVMATMATESATTIPQMLNGLTSREREILAEVAAGKSNDEIGAALHLSPATARTYVSRLLTKLHARDRSQLVSIAYESGLARPGTRRPGDEA